MFNAFLHLAQTNGATFVQNGASRWNVRDAIGSVVIHDAPSAPEAARLYCGRQGLTPPTVDAIQNRICAAYGAYRALPAFTQGFHAYRLDGAYRRNPYKNQTDQRAAWDQGANAAMLCRRAMAHLEANPADAARPLERSAWLVSFLEREGLI